MKYSIYRSGLLVVIWMLAIPASAQTAAESTGGAEATLDPEQIIAAFVERLGGEMQIQSCETARIVMRGAVSTGAEYDWTVCHNEELISSNTNDRQYYRVFAKNHAWAMDRGKPPVLLDGKSHVQGILAFPHYLTVQRMLKRAKDFELVGSAEFQHKITDAEVDTHELKLEADSGQVRHYYFDKQTGELVRYRNVNVDGTENEYYYEYSEREELGGQLFLNREFIFYSNGNEWKIDVTKVEFDVELAENQFECPKEVQLKLSD